jgi:hypothetical protein
MKNVEVLLVLALPTSPRGEPSASSFIGSSGGREVQKTLDRCLGEEGLAGTAEFAIATCFGHGQPSPGYRGDVDDGTVRHPGCCGGCAITCSRCAGVDPLLIGSGRGRVEELLRGSMRDG